MPPPTSDQIKLFSCPICNKQFKTKSNSLIHVKVTHKKEKNYKCDRCETAFGRNWTLKQHLVVHQEEKPFDCKHCSNKFKRNSDLTRHTKLCHKEKKSKCNEASRSESAVQQTHSVMHSNKRFECEQREKAFETKYLLEQHLVVHQTFQCDECPKVFQRKCSLEYHKNRCHQEKKCNQWNDRPKYLEVFGSESAVQKAHLVMHSNNPFECDQSMAESCPAQGHDEKEPIVFQSEPVYKSLSVKRKPTNFRAYQDDFEEFDEESDDSDEGCWIEKKQKTALIRLNWPLM